MTSNIGSQDLIEGLDKNGQLTEKARNAVMNELKRAFRPEFLNRVDDTVLFKSLTLGEIEKIVVLISGDLKKRLEEREIKLDLTVPALEFIAREGFDPVYGARPLKRFIQRELETKIGREIIAGDVITGGTIHVDVKSDELVFRIDNPG